MAARRNQDREYFEATSRVLRQRPQPRARRTGIARTTSRSRSSRSFRSGAARDYMTDAVTGNRRARRRLAVQHERHHPERLAVQRQVSERGRSRHRAEPSELDRRPGRPGTAGRVVQRDADRLVGQRILAARAWNVRGSADGTSCAALATGVSTRRSSSTSISGARARGAHRSRQPLQPREPRQPRSEMAFQATTARTRDGSSRPHTATAIRCGTFSSE